MSSPSLISIMLLYNYLFIANQPLNFTNSTKTFLSSALSFMQNVADSAVATISESSDRTNMLQNVNSILDKQPWIWVNGHFVDSEKVSSFCWFVGHLLSWLCIGGIF